jgi:four helix bundle protein
MAQISSFRDLAVYRQAVREAKRVFVLTKRFPREEMYSLTDQIRRASRAVASLIAEGWGRRRYVAAFVNKVDEALAESMETQAWLDHVLSCEYITREEYRSHDAAWQSIGGMLSRVIEKANTFCPAARS